MKKILMILSSNEKLVDTDSTTGVWLGEFTDPYYQFLDKDYLVSLASPKGGEPPVDPRSKLTKNISASNRRFNEDDAAQKAFANTVSLEALDPGAYDALFFPGGHGPMLDLANDERNAEIVLDFFQLGKPIAAICHGPAGLLKAAQKEPALLRDKEVTAFSNTEEQLVGLVDNVPFKLEDRLKELGARYESATVPFTSKVRVSGRLVTGQNPASAAEAAKQLMALL